MNDEMSYSSTDIGALNNGFRLVPRGSDLCTEEKAGPSQQRSKSAHYTPPSICLRQTSENSTRNAETTTVSTTRFIDGQRILKRVHGNVAYEVSSKYKVSYCGTVHQEPNPKNNLSSTVTDEVTIIHLVAPVARNPTILLTHKNDGKSLESKKNASDSRPIVSAADNKNMVVSEFKEVRLCLQLASISCLTPKFKLNDELMDFGVYSCVRGLANVVFVPSIAWESCLSIKDDPVPPHKIKSFYKMVTVKSASLLSKNFMVVPVCSEDHWILIIICNPFPTQVDVDDACLQINKGSDAVTVSKKLYNNWTDYSANEEKAPRIFVLDSKYLYLSRRGEGEMISRFHAKTVFNILKWLRILHQSHWKNTGKPILIDKDTFRWKHFVSQDGQILARNKIHHYSLHLPEQHNDIDCGVFVIMFASKCFEELENSSGSYTSMIGKNFEHWFHRDQVDSYRRHIYNVIIRQCSQNYPNALRYLIQSSPFAKNMRVSEVGNF